MLVFERDSIIGHALKEYGEWAQAEIEFIGGFLQAGAVVVDAGAFVGTHTLAFSHLVGKAGKVYAFEPQPTFFQLLHRNVEHNGLRNVELLNVALADTNGYLRSSVVDTRERSANFGAVRLDSGTRGSKGLIRISKRKLDHYALKRCDFIKIDVEGMEANVLKGGKRTLNTLRPIVYAECNSLRDGWPVVTTARDMGYEVLLHSAKSYNPSNFRKSGNNLFGEARELALVLVPKEKHLRLSVVQPDGSVLIPIDTLDDLALGLLKKPQYKQEVLQKTKTADAIGVEFLINEPELHALQASVAAAEQQSDKLRGDVAGLTRQLSDRNSEIEHLAQQLSEQDAKNSKLAQHVSERDAATARLMQQVADRDAVTARLIQQITERDAATVRLTEQISERDAATARLMQQVADRDAAAVRLTQQVAERDAEITRLTQQISERDAATARLTEQVVDRDEAAARLAQQIAERDVASALLTEQVVGRDAEIGRLTQQLVERETAIALLNRSLTERQTEVGRAMATIAERDAEIARLTGTIVERDAVATQLAEQLAERDRQVTEILSSTSWAVSAPVRFVGRMLKSRNTQSGSAVTGPQTKPDESALSRDIVYSIDSLLIKGRRVYGWGWLLSSKQQIVSITAVAHLVSGEKETIGCSSGQKRPDVATDFAGVMWAESSGFVISGWLPTGSVRELSLEWQLQDGTTGRIPLGAPGRYEDKRESVGGRKLYRLMQKAIGFLMRGDVRGLMSKINTRRNARAKQRAVARAKRSVLIEHLKQGSRPAVLIIDHNLGGGANYYRARRIAEWSQAGETVILVYYDLTTLEYHLRISANDIDRTVRLDSLKLLPELVSAVELREIFVNNLVSSDHPLGILDLLLEMRRSTGAVLTIAVHDYFPICPSWTLLDFNGRFCEIPDTESCRRCMARHDGMFTRLVYERDIDEWRRKWSACLFAADIVLCFSEVSRTLMRRAYPALDAGKLVVRPHSVDYIGQTQIRIEGQKELHIGIVGEITHHKGSLIVQEMAKIISQRRLPIKVTIIGTVDVMCDTSVVDITGPYRRKELGSIIENRGVNFGFLPSVWPETFSYVTEELIQLGLPLAVFDLGAPSERVKAYSKGYVIPEVSAACALESICDFHGVRSIPSTTEVELG